MGIMEAFYFHNALAVLLQEDNILARGVCLRIFYAPWGHKKLPFPVALYL